MTLSEAVPHEDSAATRDFPPAPRSLADTQLGKNFLVSLLVKHMYVNGLEAPEEIRDKMKLPNNLISALLKECLSRKLIESLGGGQEGSADRRYTLSTVGRNWAVDALDKSLYIGPTPIRLPDYISQMQVQQLSNENLDADRLGRCLSDLVLSSDIVSQIGSAMTFGRSMLFYGSPGNGKTSVAKALGKSFQQNIYVPYAVEVDGQVIKIFDTSVHKPVEIDAAKAEPAPTARRARVGGADARWVHCRRPIAIAGGELNSERFDSFLKLGREMQHERSKTDKASYAEERARMQTRTKFYKKNIKKRER